MDDLLAGLFGPPKSPPSPRDPREATHPHERKDTPATPIVGTAAAVPRTPPLVDPLDEIKLRQNDLIAAQYDLSAKVGAFMELMHQYQREQLARDIDIEETLHLTVNIPVKLLTKGRRYNAIIAGGSGPINLVFTRPGLTSYTFSISPGDINVFNVTDGTMLQLASGNAVEVLFICSYHFIGNPT